MQSQNRKYPVVTYEMYGVMHDTGTNLTRDVSVQSMYFIPYILNWLLHV